MPENVLWKPEIHREPVEKDFQHFCSESSNPFSRGLLIINFLIRLQRGLCNSGTITRLILHRDEPIPQNPGQILVFTEFWELWAGLWALCSPKSKFPPRFLLQFDAWKDAAIRIKKYWSQMLQRPKNRKRNYSLTESNSYPSTYETATQVRGSLSERL